MYRARCTLRGVPAASAKRFESVISPTYPHRHTALTRQMLSCVASLSLPAQHRQRRLRDLLGNRKAVVHYASGNRASISAHLQR
jgi:hypothetical protein